MKHYLVLLFLLPVLLAAGSLSIRLSFAEDEIRGFITEPGVERLPVSTVNVLLPPGSTLTSYDFSFRDQRAASKSYREVNTPWSNSETIITGQRHSISSSRYVYQGIKHWGDFTYASWQVLPYDPASGIWNSGADLVIKYDQAGAARNLIPPTFSLPSFFANSADIRKWYVKSDTRNFDYLVIGTPSLYAEISSLVALRQSQFMVVQFADIADILASTAGNDNPDKLRNYLKNAYQSSPFTYLLLLGDYDTVPTAYLTPEPDGAETVPSDFFYSDLSSNWDYDNDLRYGEYPDPAGVENSMMDFTPEIFVGRLSTNVPSEIAVIAARIVAFDSSNEPYKQKALLPSAFLNYANEPENGMPKTDGAEFSEIARQTVLRNYECDTMYEQMGIVPSYPSDYPLNASTFETQLRGTDYGIINWSAHGSPTSSSRKVWLYDDGNGIPDYWEMDWFDLVDKQSFDGITTSGGSVIFAASCYNGYIDESSSSLAEYALIKKGVGVIGATRTGWYKVGWQNPGWGGLSSYNYHFLENYADTNMRLGDAHAYANLMHTQYYLFGDPIDSGGIIWPELQNVYTYLLYGDPAVGISASPPEAEILVYIPDQEADFRLVNAIRECSHNWMNVVYSNRLIPDYDYITNFEAVFCIMGDYQLLPWEKDLLNGYLDAGGKIYMEGNVAWDMNDPFLAKFGVEAPLDNVITIEGIIHPPRYWAYNAQQDGYRELMPMIPSAQAVLWTANTDPSIHCIAVKNIGAQHQTIASSFLLSEVLDPAPAKDDSFQALIGVIMDRLDILLANDDPHTPSAQMSISAWPNPARNMINIALENHKGSPARISLYNIRGQKVHEIQLSAKNGFSSVWNAKDLDGKDCPAGIYIIKSGESHRKITLLP